MSPSSLARPTSFEGPAYRQPTLLGHISATSAVFQKLRIS